MIDMSAEDIDKVFSFLDSKNNGYIVYSEFCQIVQEKKRRKPQDIQGAAVDTLGE